MSEHNQDHVSPPPEEPKRWLDHPGSGKKLFMALAAVCLGLLVWDCGWWLAVEQGWWEVHERHGHYGFEEWFGFHALFGFVAYCCIVGTAVQLRKVLKRPEDYYYDE